MYIVITSNIVAPLMYKIFYPVPTKKHDIKELNNAEHTSTYFHPATYVI